MRSLTGQIWEVFESGFGEKSLHFYEHLGKYSRSVSKEIDDILLNYLTGSQNSISLKYM